MIKVGILSMQRIANYGSFLQAYGLKHMLEDLGCEVQFVDYHPGETLIPSNEGTGIKRKIFKICETLKYSAPLKEKIRFIKYKKNYSKNYFPYLGIEDKMNFCPEVDLLVIGSDEVFNCVQNNTNVGFAPELFGEKNNAKRLISYAASFGNTTIDKIRKYKVDSKIEKWLRNFNAISVRDKNSGNIVQTLIQKEPEYNLDPVLAYDFMGKCKKIPKDIKEKNYMILYGYAGRFSKSECSKIKKYANNKNLEIFCIGGVQDACDRFIDCDPFHVIAFFQHADYVITDTFHGSILSIITHRKFVSVVRNTGYGNAEKITDLLERLHLKDRIIDDIDKLDIMFDKEIDYKSIDAIIETEREKSYGYLKTQIKEV